MGNSLHMCLPQQIAHIPWHTVAWKSQQWTRSVMRSGKTCTWAGDRKSQRAGVSALTHQTRTGLRDVLQCLAELMSSWTGLAALLPSC
jgi:hypothetical protein